MLKVSNMLQLGVKPVAMTPAARETLGTVLRLHKPHFNIPQGTLTFRIPAHTEHAFEMLNKAGAPVNKASQIFVG